MKSSFDSLKRRSHTGFVQYQLAVATVARTFRNKTSRAPQLRNTSAVAAHNGRMRIDLRGVATRLHQVGLEQDRLSFDPGRVSPSSSSPALMTDSRSASYELAEAMKTLARLGPLIPIAHLLDA